MILPTEIQVDLSNFKHDIYWKVFGFLRKYEELGHSAEHKAAIISADVMEKCSDWIEKTIENKK